MSNSVWSNLGYAEVPTKDGSISLKGLHSPESEMMHHSGGALSESRQIYGDRLVRPLFELGEPCFLSLGLGLGYNEALIAEAGNLNQKSWKIVSYEADPQLTDSFLSFLNGEAGERGSTYLSYFQKLENPEAVRKSLLEAHQEGRWVLEGAMTAETRPPFQVHGFLWDAFSQKTSPELWEEEFLFDFFSTNASSDWAGVSTYACVAKLKRALKRAGFDVQIEEGFLKRNSTIAWRDLRNRS